MSNHPLILRINTNIFFNMDTILNQLPESLPVYSKVIEITPEIAKMLIANTEGRLQRAPHKQTILEYANLMRKGEWVLNYQPIQIGIDGNVLDGQHRLRGCIEANIPFTTLFIENVDEKVFDTMDRGRARTLGDILSSRRFDNYNTMAATIAVLYNLENERYALTMTSKGQSSGSNRHLRITPTQMNKFLSRNPNFSEFIADGKRLQNVGSKLLTPSQFIALWYFCSKSDAVKSNTFFAKLSTGASIDETNPIFFIRKKLMEFKRKETYLRSIDITNLVLKGFEMYCNGETVKSHIVIPKEPFKLKTQMKMFE